MRTSWNAATALDPGALDFTGRFPFCTPDALTEMVETAGLVAVEGTKIEVETTFADFEDYWRPFALGAGPAPGYCMSLDLEARQRLRERPHEDIPRHEDGSIHLKVRAWALRRVVPQQ